MVNCISDSSSFGEAIRGIERRIMKKISACNTNHMILFHRFFLQLQTKQNTWGWKTHKNPFRLSTSFSIYLHLYLAIYIFLYCVLNPFCLVLLKRNCSWFGLHILQEFSYFVDFVAMEFDQNFYVAWLIWRLGKCSKLFCVLRITWMYNYWYY